MEKSPSSRVYAYDNLKFLLIFCVVLGHLVQESVGDDSFCKAAFIFVYSFHMPAFLFISGLFAKKTVLDGARTRKRVGTFLILYILMKAMQFVLKIWIYEEYKFDLFSEGSVPWFMLALAAFYGVAYFTKNVNRWFLLIFSIVLSFLVGYDSSIGDFLCLSRIIVFFPYFLLGLMLDSKKLLKTTGKPFFRLIAVCMLLGLAYLSANSEEFYLLRPLFTGRHPYSNMEDLGTYASVLRLLCYVFSMVGILSVISLTPRRKTIFTTWGQRTISVYFWHYLIVYPFREREEYELLNSALSVFQTRGAIFAIALLTTIIFSLKLFSWPLEAVEKLCVSNKNE